MDRYKTLRSMEALRTILWTWVDETGENYTIPRPIECYRYNACCAAYAVSAMMTRDGPYGKDRRSSTTVAYAQLANCAMMLLLALDRTPINNFVATGIEDARPMGDMVARLDDILALAAFLVQSFRDDGPEFITYETGRCLALIIDFPGFDFEAELRVNLQAANETIFPARYFSEEEFGEFA